VAGLKYSRQRESIKDFLATRKDHPTADTVYMNIKEIYPNISLGTVYRNLALLSDIGEINKITAGDGADRFDGNIKPHNHFLCKECNSVIDIEMEDINHINDIASKNFNGIIEGHITHFYGICGNCVKKLNL
jgi:Fur family peroxide stress response transcriptional regulator